eukprot:184831_1
MMCSGCMLFNIKSKYRHILFYVIAVIVISYSQNYIYNDNYQLSQSNWEATCLFYYDQHLASSIHNESQRSEAQNIINDTSWIGLSDILWEDNWIWTDNTQFNYDLTSQISPWDNNEPNNTNAKDCVAIQSLNGLWKVDDCTQNYYALCGYPQPFNVINDDTNYIRTLDHSNNGKKKNNIGYIDILDEIYIEFYITFNTWPSGLGSILQFGDDDNQYAAIFIDGTSNNIRSSFATIKNILNYDTTSGYLLNTEYHYTLYKTQTHLTITFGGNYLYDNYTISHPIIMNRNLYCGHRNLQHSFSATIRNLKITTFNSPENRFWNYICDWNNRWTHNNGGNYLYDAIDGDCSIQQNDSMTATGRLAWLGDNDITSLDWTDYKIEVIINLLSISANKSNEAGPILRANNANCDYVNCGQYYQLQFRLYAIVFAKIDYGYYYQLHVYPIQHTSDIPYLIRIEAIGNTFKIYENNIYLFTHIDNSYSSGSIGLRTYESNARFSKMRITFASNHKQYTVKPTVNPSKSPSNNPTKNPSINPTIIFENHTTSFVLILQTVTQSIQPILYENSTAQSDMKLILFSIIGICFFVMVNILIMYRRKSATINKMKNIMVSKSEFITNPMCILLAVGEYDDEPDNPDPNIPGHVNNLEVDIDINNLSLLFKDTLKYDCVPNDENNYTKIYWTQNEIINFLKQKAQIFANNVKSNNDNENKKNYDGLIVVVSGHGMDNKLITSDYKLISKDVFHRIFSSYYPVSREVPRIIIYDCCDGIEQKKGIKKTLHNKTSTGDIGKAFEIDDITNDKRNSIPVLWDRFSENPDHKLATIHAANLGFMANMNTVDGSYLINKFVHKTLDGLDKNVEKQKFLHEIFDEIQHELGQNKQLPTFSFNNNTRYLKFIPNTYEK